MELIKCFKEAAKIKGIKSNIVTADISKTAPAIYFGDKNYIIPRIGEQGYLESIIDICNKEKVKHRIIEGRKIKRKTYIGIL